MRLDEHACVLSISYILKKILITVSLQRDQQNGGWQSGREMKCYYLGTYCLCVISLRNGAAKWLPVALNRSLQLLHLTADAEGLFINHAEHPTSTTPWGVFDMRRASRR